MTQTPIEKATEDIYKSLQNDNEDIDLCIKNLKEALAAQGQKVAEIDSARLAQKNRSGRKMMQSYFKKRGVIVKFLS